MKVLNAEFVRSAASAEDAPREDIPQIALVGRSNVGKSSLINALVNRRIARTSAAAGKTRLINLYRVQLQWTRDSARRAFESAAGSGFTGSLYLVDLPGYGYARGGTASAQEFDALTNAYFGLPRPGTATRGPKGPSSAILAADSRHPGLPADVAACQWLHTQELPVVVVATKVDRQGRAARLRALRDMETRLQARILPVSAVTGEGIEQLWNLIVTSTPPNLQ